MGKTWASIGAGLLLFASFSSSSSYKLNSYSVGPVATSNSHSTTYYTQSTGGEVAGGSASSTNYASGSGNVQTEQIATPQAPTVSNGSGSYFTYLLVTLSDNMSASNTYPADVTFSVGVSTTNCFTSACVQSGAVKFVQTGGTLSTPQFYQSYSAWGGSSGVTVTGLTPGTTYYVAVAAKQGTFTNTEYGPSASAATGNPFLTYSVSPNTLSLTNMVPGTVTTSSTVSFGLATNAAYGATIYNSGQFGGLFSSSKSDTIPASTTNLASASHGFGLQGLTTGQTTGGPLSISSPYNGTSNNVGTESSTTAPIFTTSSAITGGTATMDVQAKPSTSDPPSSDYAETLTFIAAGSF